ncbi:AMIN domain-containing protein [Dactylosporangium sp. AC04546]|uniref:AMIN domain-containing protein n=1 Tax=Dactylosporangium sp. AC04546 TaxID=2862460 RepID=UPI001EDCAA1A|nr:AMIN domain-containing protein [Dactylosporangium sp. AC04546]WVK87963.1 AMIN domain-containing protein [Dactylosporangium sp. AC04546]
MFLRRALAACAGLALALTPASAVLAADLPAPTGTAPVTGPASTTGQPTLTGVRTGRHDLYDRTVFDFTGGTPEYRVEYGVLEHQGMGGRIPLNGAATLLVVFSGAAPPAITLTTVYNPELPTLRQIKSGGYFEGYASFGLGVRDRLGFRVFTLHGPDRVVVDVAHPPTQPFGANPARSAGTAPDALVSGVRSGVHPGYDRLVFDMVGGQRPAVDVRYSGSGSAIRVTFTGQGSPTTAPHASFSGPAQYTFRHLALKNLRFTVVGAGIMTADVGTAARHGFRLMVLDNPTRVVVDVAY